MGEDNTQKVDEVKKDLVDVEVDGYKFQVDHAILDDVEILDMIDEIETQSRTKTIITFLEYILGKDGYAKMKAYYVKVDGRFTLTKLGRVYTAIFENFDPKG